MARIGIPGKSGKANNKNVLKIRPSNNSGNSRKSTNSRNSRSFRGSMASQNSRINLGSNNLRSYGGSKNSRNNLGSRYSGSSIWSKNSGPKKPRSRKQVILMAIILIAFICGLALGVSMIMGIGVESPDSGHVEYMNVTKNITAYENSSYDLQDENGTQISYSDFDENVTEGQNMMAFNATNAAGIY